MQKNKKIAVVGYKGKMGGAVYEILKKQYDVVGVEKGDVLSGDVDLVVEFTSAESSMDILRNCVEHNIPIIIGSTGHCDFQMEQIREFSKNMPIFKSGNFSVGIQNLKSALKKLITKEVQDVVIFEKHHRNKKDAPSGTAKELEEFIKTEFDVVPSIIYERGGKEIGTHIIDIYYENEIITVSHKAFSRDAFAAGVKKAVEFMLNTQNTGLYEMKHIKL